MVLWLDRPPYLRWAAASVIVVVALLLQAVSPESESYPFLNRDVNAGETITDEDLGWRQIPMGLLPPASDVVGPAVHALEEGDPFLRGSVRSGTVVPDGWWAVPAPVPESVPPGTRVRLIAVLDGFSADGIVSSSGLDTGFGDRTLGSVAVPEEAAIRMSLAAVIDQLVVLVAPR